MSILIFPPVEESDEDGFLGLGGPVSVENLLNAYRNGIFPWPWSDDHIAWFAPPERAILNFSSFHIPTSLRKALKKSRFEIRINTSFREVIEGCANATNRKKQKGTWVTKAVVEGYVALHQAGMAQSFETYLDDKLVGGLYGVGIGGYFSGESMFYTVPNASKAALTYAVNFLESRGVRWMDCQVMNPNTEAYGAIEVPRQKFLHMLREALMLPGPTWRS